METELLLLVALRSIIISRGCLLSSILAHHFAAIPLLDACSSITCRQRKPQKIARHLQQRRLILVVVRGRHMSPHFRLQFAEHIHRSACKCRLVRRQRMLSDSNIRCQVHARKETKSRSDPIYWQIWRSLPGARLSSADGRLRGRCCRCWTMDRGRFGLLHATRAVYIT